VEEEERAGVYFAILYVRSPAALSRTDLRRPCCRGCSQSPGRLALMRFGIKAHYADVRIMPTVLETWPVGGDRAMESA